MVAAAPVTVVTGPAGCGKTSLLAEWARRRDDRVTWLSLDEHDNTPARLRAAVRDALALGDAVPLTEPGFSSAVIAALDRAPASVRLVLDNVHEIRDPDALASIDLLTRQPPDRLRLVMLGRFLPPLHLARLHLEGRLHELPPQEFAFTRDETEALLAVHGLDLSPEEVDLLLRRTVGWIGGLRFAVMRLATTAGRPGDLLMFAGLDQVVSRYLGEEVLARHPQRVRDLLVATSLCETVSADLAGALTRHTSPGVVLDALERTNSFVSRLDAAPEWYRFHPVLRAHLSAELRRSRPADETALHQTAAQWYHRNNDPADALRHALHAGDDQLTAEIVEHSVLPEVLREGSGRLRAVVEAVPGHVLARPQVGVVAALVAMDAGDVAVADRVLTGIDGRPLGLRQDRVRVLHATALLRRGRFDARLREASQVMARTAAERGGTDAEVAALLNSGVAAMLSGDHPAAEQDLVRAAAMARQERFDHAMLDCQVHLAALTSASGDILAAARQAGEALAFAEEKGWQSHSVCALAYTVLGVQAYLRLDDARAAELAALAVQALGDRRDPATGLAVSTLDAAVSFPTAPDPRAVVGRVRAQWQDVAVRQVTPPVIAHIAPAVQRIALRSGDEQWASTMPEQLEAMFGPCGEQAVLRAVVHTHHARTSQARKVVEPVLSGELPAMAAPTVVDGWLLEAVLVDRAGDQRRAHEAVTRALAAAEPAGALRPFLHAGKPVRDLLARGAGRFGKLEPFATTTMTALPAASTASTDVLTSRERDLLLELPSMRTAEEIAESLFVSVNTVKTHLRGIYRKLGVNQRRDAVQAARRLGLI
ncbi:LuxR C-terminal-related transcriptional regulator [Lentzea albida]|uniref:LuxR family transcriptional regulator, maltose regulon positive regulatory protein n=1 Tax=Lentzea albida TaxID=65499 RepID=A0A1H9XC21_9PSEU|nr:LuxR C-terminal-related transcriptional regulator [Lentzea albida]SES43738.1 LuxR family transcriptional regulator, maltose regulon positive regulatory protein [Lentzea albida]